MTKINSYVITQQAKVLVDKLSQLDNSYTKEAVIADSIEQLILMAQEFGYESSVCGWTGVTEKLYEEGVLK